jgi:cytochrome P450
MSISLPFIFIDQDIFSSPHTWDPLLWTPSQDHSAEVNCLEHYLNPFGGGPRPCLGVNLAYAEIYYASAALLRRFDMHLRDHKRT